jgi:hypothetical protein
LIPSADILAAELGETLGDGLTDEDRHELDLWEKGRELQSIVNTRGFEIVLAVLQQYVDLTNQTLIEMSPGDPDVIPAHAAASALYDLNIKFRQDINAAVEASHRSPNALKKAAFAAKQQPVY